MRWSVPTKAAWLAAIALVIVVVIAWSAFLADPEAFRGGTR